MDSRSRSSFSGSHVTVEDIEYIIISSAAVFLRTDSTILYVQEQQLLYGG